MTYLFTYVGDQSAELPDLPDRLPSLKRLPEQQRSMILLDCIRGPVARFGPVFDETGVSPKPNVAAVEKKLKRGQGAAEGRMAVRDLHYSLMRAFSTADNRLAKAYRLGRSLATTCHVPSSEQALRDEFIAERWARLDEWLADLASQLPPHSSRPVRLSLSTWKQWVENPRINPDRAGDDRSGPKPGRLKRVGKRARHLTGRERPLDWERDGEGVRSALRRQGDIWRALLSGEKRGDAMLELPDFLNAARRMPSEALQAMRIVWMPLAVSALVAGGGVWLIASDDGTKKAAFGAVAVAAGVIGAVGFTWQGPLGALRRLTTRIETPLWGAVLDREISEAITETPPGAIFDPKDPQVAAPAAGPAID